MTDEQINEITARVFDADPKTIFGIRCREFARAILAAPGAPTAEEFPSTPCQCPYCVGVGGEGAPAPVAPTDDDEDEFDGPTPAMRDAHRKLEEMVAASRLPAPVAVTPEPTGWLDDKGEFHRSPRFRFLGLVDEGCGSRDHIWSGTSLAEAGEAWKMFVAQGSKDVDLTGWGCGVIADHRLMSRQFTEAAGTFACPICGQETPHQHTAEVVALHRDNEKWEQEQHVKAWQQVEARVTALADRYPPRTPLFAAPISPAPVAAQGAEQPSDTQRLDWLERQTQGDVTICPPGNHGAKGEWLVSVETGKRDRYGPFSSEHDAATLRAAIDAAMGLPPSSGEADARRQHADDDGPEVADGAR